MFYRNNLYLYNILVTRLIIEELLKDKDFEPKRWSNYRPLWYKYYRGKELPDNSFGQQEKILRK
mgnify:CR=1 FL=1